MLIHKHKSTITVTSGSGSENTLKFSGALLNHLFIEATTSTNIFDFSLVDEDGDYVYSSASIEGELNEYAIYVPFKGIYTLTISDATIDENIEIKLLVEE